jgi:long-chain acyl-CoA synthetase
MNVAGNLEKAARFFPGAKAVIDGQTELTFAQLNRRSNRTAAALASLGLEPGDHVALCAPNSYRWLIFYFGVLKAGGVVVTVSHLLKPRELAHILSDCRPRILFTRLETVQELGHDLEGYGIQHVVTPENGPMSFERLLTKGADEYLCADRDRRDTAAILYTGGTTGTPKGARLSHANIQFSAHNIAYYERSKAADRVLCFLPLNHVFAQIHIMQATVYSAGCLVMLPGFDLDAVLEAIRRHRVTRFYAVPTIYIRLLELRDLKERLSSVRYCFSAAASMAMEVVKEWKARTGLDIYEAYGMTESAAMVTYNHYYRHVVGSVGTPVNLVEVRIADETGKPLPRGARGEICIRGPNIMQAYLNNAKETAAAMQGEWFRSGDIGYLDPEGYLFIVDRLKDMIITGGENVYPREVEEVLYGLPEVQECAVVGLPDSEYGERVTAYIVPNKGCRIDPERLRTQLKRHLSAYKVPRAYVSVASLPKNNAGKILKREIRSRFSAAADGPVQTGPDESSRGR